jgi:uncharacterized coiled-coil protein SlyX
MNTRLVQETLGRVTGLNHLITDHQYAISHVERKMKTLVEWKVSKLG